MKNKQSINEWSENLAEEIFLEYKKYNWPYGIKVFYSPVIEKPDLAIISFQPGASNVYKTDNDEERFQTEDFTVPHDKIYLNTDHKMSKKIQEMFTYCGRMDLLESSVVFPLIFFRAPNVKEYKRVMGNRRAEAEKFCFLKIREILDRIQPQNILVLGMATYIHLKKSVLHSVESESEFKNDGSQRLVVTAETDNQRIFATIHPTGAHISKKNREYIKEEFSQWCNKDS